MGGPFRGNACEEDTGDDEEYPLVNAGSLLLLKRSLLSLRRFSGDEVPMKTSSSRSR